MNFAGVEKIAKAVLYEGYMLYPYRPSSTKNHQRWNFGTLYPQDWASQQRPAESWRMITECLVLANSETRLNVRTCFLQLVESPGDWQPGIERCAGQEQLALGQPGEHSVDLAFDDKQTEPGLEPLTANLSISVKLVKDDLCKLHFELTNRTAVTSPEASSRTQMLSRSLVSAHLLMALEHGEFVSLLDPPEEFREAVGACRNEGAFPVLVGEDGEKSQMLSSPIILYDYPKIAPESAGDFFDGTEMDEMLALRVMTLTEDEKKEMRHGDEQARRILDRTETLPAEHLMKVHGAIRGMRRVPEDEA